MRPTRCADLDGFLAQMQEITPRPGVVRLLQEARAAHGAPDATIDIPLLERLHQSWLERPTLH